MKQTILFFTTFIIVFYAAALGIAEDYDGTEKLPPGMKVVKVGSAEILAPKGAKTIRIADIIQVESLERYVAREFLEYGTRIKDLEVREQEITEELKVLKKEMGTLRRKLQDKPSDISPPVVPRDDGPIQG